MALPRGNLLRVVPAAQAPDASAAANPQPAASDQPDPVQMTNLASFIRTQYEIFRNHRNTANAGWNERLLSALRAFNGQYDANKLAEIQKFGGSQVYARIIAMKCRGASSLLRDVYLAPDRPWGIDPPIDPKIPPNIIDSIQQLVEAELHTLQQAGPPADPSTIRDRVEQLAIAARDAAKRHAADQAKIAEEKVDEMLTEGDFYKALAEFITDLPLFPFACIKGPTVRIVPSVDWSTGQAVQQQTPKLFWDRVSPFDLYWTPGVSDIEDAAVIERTRVTRSDLNDLLDLPGYDQNEVRAVLDEYGRGGLVDNWDSVDAERAVQENRENPQFNRSGLISCLVYTGNVQGRILLEQGMTPQQIPDELRDYMVKAYLIGQHIIKVQLTPSPRKRHEYYITSFEKVPGTPVGNGLPDILSDIQEVCNAALRSLVNNLSISSGPQVVVNDDRLAAGEDGENLYPWKRWHVTSDPMGNNTQVPISFFQPSSNAQELMGVYNTFNNIADDLSAIPKYMSGGGAAGAGTGSAGRTASGLAMLMGNASKILQTVAANIDRDILDPLLTNLSDMIMLTDTSGLLTGEENIRVMGVNVAVQRETQRSRQLELLQLTANPIDMQIIGPKGRAAMLRAVSQNVGMDGQEIVPSDDEIKAMQMSQMAQAGAAAQGGQQPPAANNDMGPRTNSQQQQPAPPPVNGGVG